MTRLSMVVTAALLLLLCHTALSAHADTRVRPTAAFRALQNSSYTPLSAQACQDVESVGEVPLGSDACTAWVVSNADAQLKTCIRAKEKGRVVCQSERERTSACLYQNCVLQSESCYARAHARFQSDAADCSANAGYSNYAMCMDLAHEHLDLASRDCMSGPTQMSLFVQLYSAPYDANGEMNAFWKGVADVASTVQVTAVVDSADGPGKAVDAKLLQGMEFLSNAGVRVLAYVSTQFGRKPHSHLRRDIDAWKRMYGVSLSGIFLDQFKADALSVNYYKAVAAYVRNSAEMPLLFAHTNGADVPLQHVAANTADAYITFDGDATLFDLRRLPATMLSTTESKRFGVVVKGQVGAFVHILERAQQYRIGYVFVSNYAADAAYYMPPSYLKEMAAQIARLNTAATVAAAAHVPASIQQPAQAPPKSSPPREQPEVASVKPVPQQQSPQQPLAAENVAVPAAAAAAAAPSAE